jgi:serine/threonine-protein kinase
MHASNVSSDYNLIFGLLALQLDFVNCGQLLEAMSAWMLQKQTPLGEILCRRGVLAEDDRQFLDLALSKHLARHGGNPQVSLAAIRVEAEIRQQLDRLDDPEVQASLASLTPTSVNSAAPPTRLPVSGDAAVLPTRLPGLTEPPVTPPTATATPLTASTGVRYRRLYEHAKGGLGAVFVALEAELSREVALKEIQDRFADHPDARARFLREAEVTAKLEHPGVVPVYGLGVYPDGRPYYAMRFIRGESLHDAIRRFHLADEDPCRDPGERSLSLRELLTHFVAVCNAVAYAHSRGVIHRDLKPANAMLGEYGETLVVDWGLARVLNGPKPEPPAEDNPVRLGSGGGLAPTEMGQAVGTPAFMPPEQAEGRLDRIGAGSDVFALGATLYCILTGQAPYSGQDVLGQARRAEMIPARQQKRSVPAALEAVCQKAMAKVPEDRYLTARALMEEVKRWLADEPLFAYREPLLGRIVKWCNRNPAMAVFVSSYLVMATIDLLFGLLLLARQSESAFQVILAVVFGPPLFASIAMSFGNVFAILNAPVALLMKGRPMLQRVRHLGVLGVTAGTAVGGTIVLTLACAITVALWSPKGPTAGGLKNWDRLPDLRLVATSSAGIGLVIGITCSLAWRLTRVWAVLCTFTTVTACCIASSTTFTLLLLPIRLN